MADALPVHIGFDSREPEAFEVAAFSLRRHASIPVDVRALRLDDLIAAGLYRRPVDPLATTEFTFSRFLVPHLQGFRGRALFFDCDFLWTGDVAGLLRDAAGEKAVWCVQHDYRPREGLKMDGVPQTAYPRKNWSSLMLFDCGHPSTRHLTLEAVNAESPAWLHRMLWAQDDEIGSLPTTWNWLAGWSPEPDDGPPRAIHYTTGGPWFEACRDVERADLWLAERARMGA